MIQRTSIPTLLYTNNDVSGIQNEVASMDDEQSFVDFSSFTTQAIHSALVAKWQSNNPFWSKIPSEHADISHIADSSQAPTIMQIRAFSNELEYPPHQLAKKLFIIWRLDEASIAAQNALLKNLEEPPTYAEIIITVKNPSWVLETIQSRSKTELINLRFSDFQNIEKSIEPVQTNLALLSKEFWKSQTLGGLSQKASSYKTKEDALQFLDQLAHLFVTHPTYPQPFMTTAIDQIQQAYFKIKGNANVALQLENCFFTIKQACWQS